MLCGLNDDRLVDVALQGGESIRRAVELASETGEAYTICIPRLGKMMRQMTAEVDDDTYNLLLYPSAGKVVRVRATEGH